jgi:alanyl-tRNA synthetase
MRLLAETPAENGRKLVLLSSVDRDLSYIKLLAQKLTRLEPNVIALLATAGTPAALVFAQSPGQRFDMGALMKEALAQLGGRGGGSKDMAQGGPQDAARIPEVLTSLAANTAAE